MGFFIPDAYAQSGGGQEGSLIGALLPLVLFLGIFWFLLLRPQQKKQKEHRAMVQALKTGDEVVTSGGLLGRITDVGDTFVTLELGKSMEIKVQRPHIANVMPKDTIKSL
tara:strand:+ start:120 stop:449 length:330 start_codon:yes stop_codon:yes gene_type:complete